MQFSRSIGVFRRHKWFSSASIPKLNLVMDIDECMIHSVFEEDAGYRQDDDRTLSREGTADGGRSVEVRQLKCEDGAPVKVNVRPGLAEFLQQTSKHFNVYAFTAALPVYARPVLQSLDPEGSIFQDAWFRSDCTLVDVNGHKLYTKDVLGTAKLPAERTVLVDNNIFSFIPIPNNGIQVVNFTDQVDDDQLYQLLPLLEHLDTEADVRRNLKSMFQLEARLQPVLDVIQERGQ